MTTERKPGWYWVKPEEISGEWKPVEFTEERLWHVWGRLVRDNHLFLIGPRIPTPDEVDQKDIEFEQKIEEDLARGSGDSL